MQPATGFVRIHLLTALFALLLAGAVLGLNLHAQVEAHYTIRTGEGLQSNIYARHEPPQSLLIEFHSQEYFGWPWPVIRRETERFHVLAIFPDELKSELKLPVNTGGCMSYGISREEFTTKGPRLYQTLQNTKPTLNVSAADWEVEDLVQHCCGTAAFFFF